MAPSSLQVYESYGLILLFMIPAFNEVNDFVAASEHSNINGLNGILTGRVYGFQTLININFNKLIFKLWFQNKFNILFQLNCNIVFDTHAWKLSRVNNVPNKASHLQPIDYFWNCNLLFIMI